MNKILKMLFPKMKPISIGIIYRPPTQSNFLDTLTRELVNFNIDQKEIYLLGDFNVNLLYGTKYILKEKCNSSSAVGPLINKYKEFCQKFSFTQLIRNPTRITSNSSTLLDHILSNSKCNNSNHGVIEIGLSDHQLIFCTRKKIRQKFNTHNHVQQRVFKNYIPEKLIHALKEIKFPNYDLFVDVNIAYSDFISNFSTIINTLAPIKRNVLKLIHKIGLIEKLRRN